MDIFKTSLFAFILSTTSFAQAAIYSFTSSVNYLENVDPPTTINTTILGQIDYNLQDAFLSDSDIDGSELWANYFLPNASFSFLNSSTGGTVNSKTGIYVNVNYYTNTNEYTLSLYNQDFSPDADFPLNDFTDMGITISWQNGENDLFLPDVLNIAGNDYAIAYLDSFDVSSEDDGENFYISSQITNLTPAAVPLPASFFLMGSSLVGLGVLARRK